MVCFVEWKHICFRVKVSVRLFIKYKLQHREIHSVLKRSYACGKLSRFWQPKVVIYGLRQLGSYVCVRNQILGVDVRSIYGTIVANFSDL